MVFPIVVLLKKKKKKIKLPPLLAWLTHSLPKEFQGILFFHLTIKSKENIKDEKEIELDGERKRESDVRSKIS